MGGAGGARREEGAGEVGAAVVLLEEEQQAEHHRRQQHRDDPDVTGVPRPQEVGPQAGAWPRGGAVILITVQTLKEWQPMAVNGSAEW
jgi:hypothetical protein